MAILVQSNKKPNLTFPTLTGSIVTFNSQYAGLPLKSHTVSLVAKQESGTPSPSNPLLISGWDAIRIGSISDNTNINYFKGVLNGTYGFIDLGDVSWSLLASGRHRTPNIPNMYSYSGSDTDFICSTYKSVILDDIADIDKSITLYTSGGSLYAQVNDSDLNGISGADFKDAVSGVLIYKLATPTTPSFTNAEFEALCEAFGMNGQYVEIQIGSTIYGGTYDAISGLLTVTHKGVNISDVSWNRILTDSDFYVFSFRFEDKAENYNMICSSFAAVEKSRGNLANYEMGTYNTTNAKMNICIRDDDYTDVPSFQTAMAGQKIVYELATPQTIQLSGTQILSLMGQNNIWADTGDTTLQYIKLG